MPVEIKELIIRAVIGGDKKERKEPSAGLTSAQKEELVQECVDQVLKVLDRQNER